MSDVVAARIAALEAQPLRVAGPRPGFARGTLSSIRDIAGKRELLDFLVRRELKAKYKDSVLGFFWSVMRPLVQLGVYYVAIGKFMGSSQHTPDFAVFIYTGLAAWTLFSEIMLGGTGSIVANSGLVKKVYLPREVFPLSVVGSALFNFAIQLVILIGATVLVGKFPVGARWWYFVLALAVLLVWATALALLLSAINVYLRDVQYLVDVVLMMLFWASPIVYTWDLVARHIAGTWLGTAYLSNPITLVVLGFQRTFWVASDAEVAQGRALFPQHLTLALLVALGVGMVALWLCQRVFARLQSNFAQEL